jgi:beta-galactosidase
MTFSKDFLWGVSISGFQFEMGGRRENWDTNTDWWVWTHDEYNIKKRIVSGDLPENGVNYWELYKRDHQLAQELGLNAFRLSTEWSRIFPTPTDKVEVGVEREGRLIKKVEVDERALHQLDELANQAAVERYRKIIQDLRDRKILVILNLNHFTLPLWIHNPLMARKSKLTKGPLGWLEERTVVEFTKYAAYMAWKFGDLVDYWSTFNEPMGVILSYLLPVGFPPNVLKLAPRLSRFPLVKAGLNMLLAHCRAYDQIKRYDRKKAERRSFSPADVGLIYNITPAYPLRKGNPFHEKASEFQDYLSVHWFLQAVSFGFLDAGFNPSQRREETCLKGRLDWLGINYYTRSVNRGWVFPLLKQLFGVPVIPQPVPGYGVLGGFRRLSIFGAGQMSATESLSLEGNPVSEDFGWEIYPEGLARCVKIMERYSKRLYITENGISDSQDKLRPEFIKKHLLVVEKLIGEGHRIGGYFHWSLLDNYEWARGFRNRFGLCAVDLKTKERKPRGSFKLLRGIIDRGTVGE